MKLQQGGGPTRPDTTRKAVGILALAVLLVTVAACGSKSAEDKASDELNAGLAASAAGRVDEAASHYKACVAFDSTNKYCIFDLGVLAQAANGPGEAEIDYRLALLLDPDFAPALYNLAILRTGAGATAEAIALYRHMLELDSGDASGHFNLGLALAVTGDVEGARKELAEGVRLNPELVIPSPLTGPSRTPAPTKSPTPSATPPPTPTSTVTLTPGTSPTVGPEASAASAGPTITSLSPTSYHRGLSNVGVTVTGTGFVKGVTLAFSGGGITVTTVTRTGTTRLTARISLSRGAAIGTRDVTVINPGAGSYTVPNGFTVLK